MFSVSKETEQKVRLGQLSSSDLQLRQTVSSQGKTWEIITKNEQPSTGSQIAAEGKDLQRLFEEAANGMAISASHFKELGQDGKFIAFARRLPFVETPQHRASVQKSVQEKVRRAKIVLKEIVKGGPQLTRLKKPHRFLDTEEGYALKELVIPASIPIKEAKLLSELWKESDSPLSLREWLGEITNEWRAAKSGLELLPWLKQREFDKSEKAAWQKDNPNEVFTEEKFKVWRQTQYDPSLGVAEPRWMLERFWKEKCEELQKDNKPQPSFDDWLAEEISFRKNLLNDIPKDSKGIVDFPTPIDDATFKIIDQQMFELYLSGSPLDRDVWMARRAWLASNPSDTSDSAFREYIAKKEYAFAANEAAEKSQKIPNFETWKQEKENKLYDRYKATHCSLPYEEWKVQQERDLLVLQPFVRLNPTQRKAYQADCQGGKLLRGGEPFSTEKESTAHSKEGWVIFVLGPQQELYCASHLPDVFHHSSFLGDGAVMAGGEIKTDAHGQIVGLTSKSGHYKPTAEENCIMLEWFLERGCDLSKINDFKYFSKDGEKAVNAKDYLDKRGNV